jgi:hypothetical protein
MDLERALNQLPEDQQAIVMLTFRERENQEAIAKLARIGVGALAYKLPEARRASPGHSISSTRCDKDRTDLGAMMGTYGSNCS